MAEREVVYTIRYQADPKAAQTLQDMARQHNDTLARMAQSEQQAAVERSRTQATQEAKHAIDTNRAHAEWLRRRHDNAERLMREHTERQTLMARAHSELVTKIQTTAAEEMERGSRLALRGIEQIGRGLVILKAIDEETAQSALKLVGGFEAMVQLGKGVYNTYTGLSRAVEAYAVSARAAAIAQAALNAAQTGGSMAGAASSARGLGGLGGLAGAGISAAAAAATTPLGLVGIPLAAAGGALMLNNALTEHWTAPGTDMKAGGWGAMLGGWMPKASWRNALDPTSALYSLQWESGQGFAGANAMLERSFYRGDMQRIAAESDIARTSAMGGLDAQRQAALNGVSGLSASGMNRQALLNARQRAMAAQGAFGAAADSNESAGASLSRQAGAAREEVAANQELVRLTQQRYAIEMDRIAETRKSSAEAIRNAKSLADGFRAIRDMEKERVQSAEQRFGSLDVLQRQSVLQAARKASRGEELSEAESRQLDAFSDLGNLGTAINRSRSARAQRGGFSELSRLTGADQRAAAAAFFATDAEVSARSVIKAETDIRVKLDADAKSLGTQIADELKKQFEELKAAMLKQLEAERRARENDRNVSAAKSRAAAGG